MALSENGLLYPICWSIIIFPSDSHLEVTFHFQTYPNTCTWLKKNIYIPFYPLQLPLNLRFFMIKPPLFMVTSTCFVVKYHLLMVKSRVFMIKDPHFSWLKSPIFMMTSRQLPHLAGHRFSLRAPQASQQFGDGAATVVPRRSEKTGWRPLEIVGVGVI